MNSEEQEARALDIAHSVALAEMLRLVIGEYFFDKDPVRFRQTMARLESAAIESINGRRLFHKANDYSEAFIKESACGYISRFLASIIHPSETPHQP